MREARYDLIVLNHTSCESVESLVQELLTIIDKVGDPYLEYKLSEALLFEQSNHVILDNITRTEAEHYQEKFHKLDIETSLRPILQSAREEPTHVT